MQQNSPYLLQCKTRFFP